MLWRVEINNREGVFDSLAADYLRAIKEIGIDSVKSVRLTRVYYIEGDLGENDLQRIAQELLSDPIVQSHAVYPANSFKVKERGPNHCHVEIAYNPGVMDPVEASTLKGIRDLGLNARKVSTSRDYRLTGHISPKQLEMIVDKVLSNKLIQHVVKSVSEQALVNPIPSRFNLIQVNILDADDKQLMKISRDGALFLNLTEMKAIQAHFKGKGRNPTDCELETIAQTWSEHCYHKTFRGDIDYTYKENGKLKKRKIKGLLKSTIKKATETIKAPWCVSVFHDNAGVIEFDDKTHVCFKVETHNHPSALEPFGGANTGIGGVIRDTLGTGLGAKPICNTDIFCFAPPDFPNGQLPAGTLHPRRVMKGVVSGVRDYGNKMGIPTVNGAIAFDKGFVGNPLVFCGSVGLLPVDKVKKQAQKGDLILALGGRTGRDGIHGATFSSGELTSESEVISSGAVQIGDPIQEKKVLDALMIARDRALYDTITDCGAGGFSSAVGEMGAELGARVDLEKAPLKYQGLSYMEIWISESQERMVLSVPPQHKEEILKVFAGENVEATIIGEFTGTGKLELFYENCQVCELDMDFLHEGTPRITKQAVWQPPAPKKAVVSAKGDLNEALKRSLSHYNVCSKEWVIRQYDHEVQGGSIIKPLTGVANDGPSDAGVIAPKFGSTKGIAIANGINFRYGTIDPYWMAASCIDEAIRQIVAVGGNVGRIAILDNFCWGNPDKAERLGSLVRCAEGCFTAAVAYKTPFISGKDSLYNEFTQGKRSIAIPGTILISAIGIIDDVRRCVTMDLKKSGNLIYVIGPTYNELGGSIYLDVNGKEGGDVPKPRFAQALKTFRAVSQAILDGLIRSAHDCSEGGFGIALAEMAFSGGFGVTARLDKVDYKDKLKDDVRILFSESNSRFVVEVEPENRRNFESAMKGISARLIARVEDSCEFVVYGVNQRPVINTTIDQLKEAWQAPLRW